MVKQSTTTSTYIALFEPREGGGYCVMFPDLPGLVSMGDNYDETCRMAHEGLASHIDFLMSEGDDVPPPRTLEEIERTWEDWHEWEGGKFLAVPIGYYPLAAKPKRINVVLDGNLVDRLDKITDNRSAYINKLLSNSLSTAYCANAQ